MLNQFFKFNYEKVIYMEIIRFLHLISPILPIVILTLSVFFLILIFIFDWLFYLGNFFVFFSFLLSFFSLFYINSFSKLHYFSNLIQIDLISKISIFLLLFSSLYSFVFASFQKKNNKISLEFSVFLILSVIGSIIVSISCHFATYFIGIELLFLSSIGLIANTIYKNNILISIISYIIVSIFSSLLFLLGISLIYAISGNLSINHINLMFMYHPSIFFNKIMLFGFSLIFLSFFFKMSLFPLHTWMPEIYCNTDSSILIYFSLAAKIAIFSFLLKLLFFFPSLINIFYFISFFKCIIIISIIFGNFMALFQKNINKLIGYTSITSTAWLLFFLLIINPNNYNFILEAIVIYLLNYVLCVVGFFSIKSILEQKFYDKSINNHSRENIFFGLFHKNPFLGIVMTIILFSLFGFPLTFGFWGKFYILKLILQEKLWFFLTAFVFSNVIGVHCYLSFLLDIFSLDLYLKFFKKKEIRIFLLEFFFIFVIAIILLLFGIFPNYIQYFSEFFLYN